MVYAFTLWDEPRFKFSGTTDPELATNNFKASHLKADGTPALQSLKMTAIMAHLSTTHSTDQQISKKLKAKVTDLGYVVHSSQLGTALTLSNPILLGFFNLSKYIS